MQLFIGGVFVMSNHQTFLKKLNLKILKFPFLKLKNQKNKFSNKNYYR